MANNSMATGDFPPWPLYPNYGPSPLPVPYVISLGLEEKELLRRLVEVLEKLTGEPK